MKKEEVHYWVGDRVRIDNSHSDYTINSVLVTPGEVYFNVTIRDNRYRNKYDPNFINNVSQDRVIKSQTRKRETINAT